MSSTYKNCPNCGSNKIAKIGFQSGRRRFKCKECGKKFQTKKQSFRKRNLVVDQLTFKKNLIQI
jgi:transposase-like protein